MAHRWTLYRTLPDSTSTYQHIPPHPPSLPSPLTTITAAAAAITTINADTTTVNGRYGQWQDSTQVGDAFKLYHHLNRAGESGFAGILFTAFLNLVLMSMSATLFYLYYLMMHHNGQ
jgi:hypothetical protein